MERPNKSENLQGPKANECDSHWNLRYTIPNVNLRTTNFFVNALLEISCRGKKVPTMRRCRRCEHEYRSFAREECIHGLHEEATIGLGL
jgi:hypothetical protein